MNGVWVWVNWMAAVSVTHPPRALWWSQQFPLLAGWGCSLLILALRVRAVLCPRGASQVQCFHDGLDQPIVGCAPHLNCIYVVLRTDRGACVAAIWSGFKLSIRTYLRRGCIPVRAVLSRDRVGTRNNLCRGCAPAISCGVEHGQP